MDGTLWDSAENVAASWTLALQKNGFPDKIVRKEDMYRVMGKTMDDIAEELFPFTAGEKRRQLLQSCCQVENDYLRQYGGILYPDLKETMELLKDRYHLYIVSNCQAGYIEAFLDYFGFGDLFEDFACFGNNGHPKADNIRLVVQRNQLERAVYIGDIQGDCDATEAAGLPFIHVAYGFGQVRQPAAVIHGLKELPEVMEHFPWEAYGM